MTHDPRTEDDIYDSLRSSLTGKITKLSNFTERSFNYIWTRAFASEVRRLETLAFVSEISGWIDYSGGPITEDDLDELGVADSIDVDEVNEFISEDQLDKLVEIVGVDRFEGAAATGTVTIDTQSEATTIPEGTILTTIPDEDGNVLRFETTADASTNAGESIVTDVPIEAEEIGPEYNVPGGTRNTASIVRFDDPPLGVRGVHNPDATTGGEEQEPNEDLRQRARGAVVGASEGGTVKGIEKFIRQNVDAVREGDIILEEFTDVCPPYVDVIVDGGNDSDVESAIEESRPAGVRHNLIRPQILQIGANIDVLGQGIDTDAVEGEVEDFFLELGIGENLYEDNLVREIMRRDSDILNIDFLDLTIDTVSNERFTFSTNIDAAIADDGGTRTTETTDANDEELDDITLLPESPAVGDAYYFGDSLPFSEFDLHISNSGSGTWDIVWEYYNGSSWDSINATDDTNNFFDGGRSTISWSMPNDWQKTNINGEIAYFVRARLDSFDSNEPYVQPLGKRAFITGGSYRLDYTYDEGNGGDITIEDIDGVTYTKGQTEDFVVTDQTGDGWKETIVWQGSGIPDNNQTFSVDYDVTLDKTPEEDRYYSRLVRDERNIFGEGRTQELTYTGDDRYRLDETPFVGSTSIEDDNNNTYSEGVEYELVSAGRAEETDDFTYSSSKDVYYLEAGADETSVVIEDDGGEKYQGTGTDYQLIDTDGDGIEDAVDWDVSPTSTPDDGDTFIVDYRRDNGYPATIDWSGGTGSGSPSSNVDFTVTYNKKVYETFYEVMSAPDDQIHDASGTTYAQGTDYEIIDHDVDGENDAISWPSNPSTLSDGEEFYITYETEGDIVFESRSKADPGLIDVEVNNG